MRGREAPTSSTPARDPLAVVVGLFVASLALRPQLLAIGPLLPAIRPDLDIPASVAGLLVTIPVLCMGIFAPVGPRIAARLGPRATFALCLALIAACGLLRAAAPSIGPLLLATFGIGVGVGMAGAVPSMVVSLHLPHRRVLGTGAYAGGIAAGSAISAAIAVPLAGGGDWQRSLAIITIGGVASLVGWLALTRPEGVHGHRRAPALRLPLANRTVWLLALAFGLQSLIFYGTVAWLPNALVERGWSAIDTGFLIGMFNGVGVLTTLGVPLVAERLGTRRGQLTASSIVAAGTLVGINLAPDATVLWVALLGLALGAIFPLILTLPLDVADAPAHVGAVAATMLLGGYLLSSVGPFALGAARDLTGGFAASLWLLLGLAIALVACCLTLTPTRLRHGVRGTAPSGQLA